MKIRYKIILLTSGLLMFLVITGLFTYFQFTKVASQLREIATQNMLLSNKVVALNLQHLEHTELFKKVVEKGILLESHQVTLAGYDSAKTEYSGNCMMFDQGITDQQSLINDAGEFQFLTGAERMAMKHNIDSVRALHDICQPRAGKVFAYLEKADINNALPLADTFYANEKKINSQLTGLLSSYNQYAGMVITMAEASRRQILYRLLGMILLVTIAGVTGAFFLARGIITSLNSAVWFARNVEQGKRDLSFTNIPSDEIGDLLQTLRNMLKALRESEQTVLDEKKKSDDLLCNILPEEVAAELKEKGYSEARYFDPVTVLFTDFKGFTTAAERLTPHQLVAELDTCFKAFDGIMAQYGVEKIKTVGDAYLAAAGLPVASADHARQAARAAIAIRDFMGERRKLKGDDTFQIRIGLHTGGVVAGIVGVRKFAYDIWGDTVNTAARMEQNSEPGRINISGTTFALIKEKFACTSRGEIEAKNKGALEMYFLESEHIDSKITAR